MSTHADELEGVDIALTADHSTASAEATAAPAAPVQSPAEEWAELPKMFGSILAAFPPLKELDQVYTDASCRKWGDAMVPIAAARGWTAAQALAWLGPYVALGLASHALLTPTVMTITRVIREAKAARAAAAAASAADKPVDTPAAA